MGIYERQEGIYRDKPQVIFKAAVYRKTYVQRLRWALLALITSGGVWYAFSLPMVTDAVNNFTLMPEIVRGLLLGIARMVAALLLLFSTVRFVYNLFYAIRRRTERIKFFDVGFLWERGGVPTKYGWNSVKTIRENPHVIYFRQKPLIQWGDISFKMRDGSVYRFQGRHGDMNAFLKRVSPYYSAEIGARMGEMLRMNKKFKIHPKIVVSSAGLTIAEKKRVPWKNLYLKQDDKTLMIGMIDEGGNIRPVFNIATSQVDNLGGFMEIAEATMENLQRHNPYAT